MARPPWPALGGRCGVAATLVLALLWAAPPRPAAAAGLFLAPRGLRPLARAGAFVAGADDAQALGYNPAGLAHAASEVLIDLAWPLHRTHYTRRVTADGPNLPTVQGRELGLPSPTLAAVWRLPAWTRAAVAGGVAADLPLMQNWPSPRANADTPQRYAAGDFRGTALVKASLAAGWRAWEPLSLGLGLNLLAGSFASSATLSTCDGVLCTQAENPDYDADIQLHAGGIAVVGLHAGAIWRALPWLRLGLAWESGYRVDQPAAFKVQLPRASAYSRAHIVPPNPTGRVQLRLPQIWRLGAEVRRGRWRAELAAVWEGWQVHDQIDVVLDGVRIEGLFALGDYGLASPMVLERGYRNTGSLRLGGEWRAWQGAEMGLTLRAGAMVEPSAIRRPMLTALAVDLDKLVWSAGAALSWRRWQAEVTLAALTLFSVRVDDSQILQLNPTRPPWPGRTAIGNGDYRAAAAVVGAGLRYAL